MITTGLFEQVIDTAVNRSLALDPELPEKLGQFSGKVICLHFTGLDKKLYLLTEDSQMRVLRQYDGKVDTCISGSPMSIVKMLMKPNVATMLLKGEVEISGDTRLGHAFKKLFREMDINWQQPMSGLIGDAATQQLESTLLRASQWTKKSAESIAMTSSEYLQEESRDIVTETELEMFNQQVDTLRDDSDRLEARLKNLTKK